MHAAGSVAVGADIQLRTRTCRKMRCNAWAGKASGICRRPEGAGEAREAQRFGGGGQVQCRDGSIRGLNCSPLTAASSFGARPRNKPLNQSAPIVDIRNLDYAVNGRPVFAGLDIQIPRGKITAVMGPSGTGQDHAAAADHRSGVRRQRLHRGGGREYARDRRAPSLYVLRRPHGHAVPERRAAHGFERVRKRRLSAARAHRFARAADPPTGADKIAGGGSARRGGIDARGAVRRHGPARGAGARHRHGSGNLDLR